MNFFGQYSVSVCRVHFIIIFALASSLVIIYHTTKKDHIEPKPFYTENKTFTLLDEDLRYNLLGMDPTEGPLNSYCNFDHMNEYRLQQDHPCVIDIIRRHYLHYPSPPETPLGLDRPTVIDPSAGQSSIILPYVKNKTGGFFVECGAADGELGSNTLYMERFLDWGGVLIEADQTFFEKLLTRNRKAHALPVCLSLKPYPMEVLFNEAGVAGKVYDQNLSAKHNVYALQCFPLYSILLAVGKTTVDYFSVDVEGSESQILKSIPWHRIKIKALTVEVTSRNATVVQDVKDFMERQGYTTIGLMDGDSYYDLVFVYSRIQ